MIVRILLAAITVSAPLAVAQNAPYMIVVSPDGERFSSEIVFAGEGIYTSQSYSPVRFGLSEADETATIPILLGGTRTTVPWGRIVAIETVGDDPDRFDDVLVTLDNGSSYSLAGCVGAVGTNQLDIPFGVVICGPEATYTYRFMSSRETRAVSSQYFNRAVYLPSISADGLRQFGTRYSGSLSTEEVSFGSHGVWFRRIVLQPNATSVRDGAAEPPAAASSESDVITLRNGDILSGAIQTGSFTIQASYGTLSFDQDDLASIILESPNGNADQFLLRVGDRVSGVMSDDAVVITLSNGTTITLQKGSIDRIAFGTD